MDEQRFQLLTKLLPDLITTIGVQADIQPPLNSRQLLEKYFSTKQATCKDADKMDTEVFHIQKFFPRAAHDSIHKHLYIFRDFPNRVEIVLRLLLLDCNELEIYRAKEAMFSKRPNIRNHQEVDSVVPIKIRRVEGTHAIVKNETQVDGSVDKMELNQVKAESIPIVIDEAEEQKSELEVILDDLEHSYAYSPNQIENNFVIDSFKPAPPQVIPQGRMEPAPPHVIAQGKVEFAPPQVIPQGKVEPAPPQVILQGGVEPAPPQVIPQGKVEPAPPQVIPQGRVEFAPPQVIPQGRLETSTNYFVAPSVLFGNGNMNGPETNVQASVMPGANLGSCVNELIANVQAPMYTFGKPATQLSVAVNEPKMNVETSVDSFLRPSAEPIIINAASDGANSEESFDLVGYLEEITKAPRERITNMCELCGCNLNQRPKDRVLTTLINNLLTHNNFGDEDSGSKINSMHVDLVEEKTTPKKANPIIKPATFLHKPYIERNQVTTNQNQQSSTLSEHYQYLLKKRDELYKTTMLRIQHQATIQSQNLAIVNVNSHPKTVKSATNIVPLGSSQGAIKKQNVIKVTSSKPATITSGQIQMESESTTSYSVDSKLVNALRNMFPDACPNYLNHVCRNRSMSEETVDELITIILDMNGNYPKRSVKQPEPEIYPEDQYEILCELLPDADPDYLRRKCDEFSGKPELVKQFINTAMETKEYPTMKDYQRRQQLSAQQKQYTTEFNVENFVNLIPNPHTTFTDPKRQIQMDQSALHYANMFLRNTFDRIQIRTIQSAMMKNQNRVYLAYLELAKLEKNSALLMKTKRRQVPLPLGEKNIPLLQEIAYCAHRKEIGEYIREKKFKEMEAFKVAKENGLLKTCNCCYDEEVLPSDTFSCPNGCVFCKACIVKSTEVLFGEGKLDFPCLMNCSAFFTLQTLQSVLSPKLFSKIAQKKAVEEVKAAGIEELEMCPFCDFATIPAEGDKIFHCLNPDCMKESCRACKEPSHVPYRCDEIEKDEQVKARVFIENKMTEALLRKCWKCGVKFFKEEGCNKMTCSCGAQMCYVCKQPVKDYKHFNGNGGDRYDLCPLYSNSNDLNKENVLKGAQEAKAQLGNAALKIDPSMDVDEFYQKRAKQLPPPHEYVPAEPVHVIVRRLREEFMVRQGRPN